MPDKAIVKISGKPGAGANGILQTLYKDYQNTHLASRKTSLTLEQRELEEVLSNEEMKDRLKIDDRFEKHFKKVIHNSLVGLQKDSEKLTDHKEMFKMVGLLTEAPSIKRVCENTVAKIARMSQKNN